MKHFLNRFLFETESRRVLHTGDFRLSVADIQQIKHLHVGPHYQRTPKTIDHLYIDTTFCSPHAPVFPCRQKATQEAIHHIREWLDLGSNYYVNLSFPGIKYFQ